VSELLAGEPRSIADRAHSLRLQRIARSGEVVARSQDPIDRHIAARAEALRRSRVSYRDAYKAAEISRLTLDWMAGNDRADREVMQGMLKLRARARELSRNASPIKHFRRLLAMNVIGPKGFRIKTTDSAHRKGWQAFAKSKVTVDGRLTYNQLSRLALKTVATDGEAFIRMHRGFPNRWGFALQMIDADQVDDRYNLPRANGRNEVRMGIEVDFYGRPVAYHVFEDPAGIQLGPGLRKRIPADEIVHVYDPERPNQTRGITWYTSAMFPLKMLEGYKEAEVVAARTAAAKMGFFTPRDGITGEMMGETGVDGAPPSMEAAPGTFEALPPGYEFQEWNPQHPSTAFDSFLIAMMRDVSSGLGVSYNALANDLERTSYASGRMGMLIDRDIYETIQEWWVSDFQDPIHDEWVMFASLKGALETGTRDGSKFKGVPWIGRGWDWVDPLKDVQASSQEITAGLNSRTRLSAARGEEFEEIAEELAREEETAQKLKIDITPKGAAFAPADPNKTDSTSGNGNGNGRSRLGALAQH
jgi:lambda family phage portal protein